MKTNFLHCFCVVSLCVLNLVVAAPLAASAAEIRFRSDIVVPRGSVVTLGEIAEIVGDESERLRNQVISPAPSAGETLQFDRVALRDMLTYLGVGTTAHTLAGADVVTVVAAASAAPRSPQRLPSETTSRLPAAQPLPPSVAPITQRSPEATLVTMASFFTHEPPKKRLDQVYPPPQRVREIEAAVAQQISDYLNECVAAGSATPVAPYPWVIVLKLEPLVAKRIDTAGGVATISGGCNPVIGPQQLGLVLGSGETLSLAVRVALPTQAVVVQRPIPRGKQIATEDVAIVALENPQGENYLRQISDAVGMEAASLLREGTPLTLAMVAAPMCVRKNETVTVYSRAAGITIKTYGKSKEDAPQGGLVQIERQDRQRDTFYARVIGHGTVEVTADAAVVRNEMP